MLLSICLETEGPGKFIQASELTFLFFFELNRDFRLSCFGRSPRFICEDAQTPKETFCDTLLFSYRFGAHSLIQQVFECLVGTRC